MILGVASSFVMFFESPCVFLTHCVQLKIACVIKVTFQIMLRALNPLKAEDKLDSSWYDINIQ